MNSMCRCFASLLSIWLHVVILGTTGLTGFVQGQQTNTDCPARLEIWVYESMDACTSNRDPVVRGQIQVDGMCHQTIITDDRNNNSIQAARLLPGTYAAECVVTNDETDDIQQNVRFLHSGCLYDDCAITQQGREVCDQLTSSDALSVYYSRLTPPGLLPVTDWSLVQRQRTCSGITLNQQTVLVFSIVGNCTCNQEMPPTLPPVTSPPTPRPTLRRTEPPQPTSSPTTLRPTTQMPSPTPTREQSTIGTIFPTTTSPSEVLGTTVSLATASPTTTDTPTESPTTLQPSITFLPTSSTHSPTTRPTSTFAPTVFPADESTSPFDTTIPSGRASASPTTSSTTYDSSALAVQHKNETKLMMIIIATVVGSGALLCLVSFCTLRAHRRRQKTTTPATPATPALDHPQDPQGHLAVAATTAMPKRPAVPISMETALREISIDRNYRHPDMEETTLSSLSDPSAVATMRQQQRLGYHSYGEDIGGCKDDSSLDDIYTDGEQDVPMTRGRPTTDTSDTKPQEFHVQVPPGPLGLLIQVHKGRWRVHKISTDSSFATNGDNRGRVRVGDYLNAVDQFDVKYLTPATLVTLMQTRTQSWSLFTFERPGLLDRSIHSTGAADKKDYTDHNFCEEESDDDEIYC